MECGEASKGMSPPKRRNIYFGSRIVLFLLDIGSGDVLTPVLQYCFAIQVITLISFMVINFNDLQVSDFGTDVKNTLKCFMCSFNSTSNRAICYLI